MAEDREYDGIYVALQPHTRKGLEDIVEIFGLDGYEYVGIAHKGTNVYLRRLKDWDREKDGPVENKIPPGKYFKED